MIITEKSFCEAFSVMWADVLEPMIRDEVRKAIDAKKAELQNHVLFHFRRQEKLRQTKLVEEQVGILVEGVE